MTPRQKEYVDCLVWFFGKNDQLPPAYVLAGMVGSTTNAASEMMGRLEKMGVVEKNSLNKYKRGKNWPT